MTLSARTRSFKEQTFRFATRNRTAPKDAESMGKPRSGAGHAGNEERSLENGGNLQHLSGCGRHEGAGRDFQREGRNHLPAEKAVQERRRILRGRGKGDHRRGGGNDQGIRHRPEQAERHRLLRPRRDRPERRHRALHPQPALAELQHPRHHGKALRRALLRGQRREPGRAGRIPFRRGPGL